MTQRYESGLPLCLQRRHNVFAHVVRRNRFRLRGATQLTCLARYPIVGSPSSYTVLRSRIAVRWCRIRRGKVEIKFDVPDSVHANTSSSARVAAALSAATPRRHSGCRGCDSHRGRSGRRHAQWLGARRSPCLCGSLSDAPSNMTAFWGACELRRIDP